MRLEWTGREWIIVTDDAAITTLDQAVDASVIDADALIDAIVEERTAILQ
jgi:hypothetical protein